MVNIMVTKVSSDIIIYDDSILKADSPAETEQPFGDILSQSLTTNYDLLKNHFYGIFKNCTVNDIDTSKVKGWDRLDFPKAKAFDENCTLEDLQRIKLTGSAPTNQLDPKVQKALNFSKQNGILILISPEAIERMNSDEGFYNKIMADLNEHLYPGVLDHMREEYTYQWGDITYKSVTTDASIIATVNADGEVEYEYVSGGYLYRVDGEAPNYYTVIANQEKEEEKHKHIDTEQLPGLFLLNNTQENLELQMAELAALMKKKNK